MKKCMLLLSLSLLLALQATAQNLKVVDFQLLANDLTANLASTERYDRNGDKCAVIKIQTPERGFFFDCGLMGYTHLEEHPGETWLWVSPRLLSLTISHEVFGKCQYTFQISIESARTYQMLLDIGIGRFVNITTSMPNSSVTIDGASIGLSPIYNHYLSYGVHTIKAERDKHMGTLKKVMTDKDAPGMVISVDMVDQTQFYGDVTVNADPYTELYYDGKMVGTGQWRTQLREGPHSIEARKADCDPQTTSFTVVKQRQNSVEAIAPIPHTGRLKIYTRPRDAQAVMNGTQTVDLTEAQTLRIGTYQLAFSRKGYVPLNREFIVVHDSTTADTVALEPVKYVKPLAFYFGAGYTLRSLGGITALAGAVFNNFDLQLSYTFGLGSSDDVPWYTTDGNDTYLSRISYKRSTFDVKLGYQFELTNRLGITPQVGMAFERLSGTVSDGTNLYGDGAAATCISLGAKLLYAPMQRVYLFAAPAFSLAVSKDDNFKRLADNSDIGAGGFMMPLGAIFNF